MRPAITLSAVILLLIVSFLLSGALGLKATLNECDSSADLWRESEVMSCYYTVAITQAYLSSHDPMAAADGCTRIWTKFGASHDPQDGSDIRKEAETLTNQCYYEVAKITRDEYPCNLIQQRDDFGTELTGADATQTMCLDNVARLQSVSPEHYYDPGNENICIMVYVLPLVALGASRIRLCP